MRQRRGFTLIELLIAIAIIAVLAAVVFIALNPSSRYAKARDGKRWNDVETIASAINALLTTSDGTIPGDLNNMPSGSYYMLGTGNNSQCPVRTCAAASGNVSTSLVSWPNFGCIDLSQELANQIRSIPVDPTGGTTWSTVRTGYYIRKTGTSIFTVGACQPEATSYISATR
jgi:prepilin-type N-terminal cleavage/methylation domain-containing protein